MTGQGSVSSPPFTSARHITSRLDDHGIIEEARLLQARAAQTVVVTLGARGAICSCRQRHPHDSGASGPGRGYHWCGPLLRGDPGRPARRGEHPAASAHVCQRRGIDLRPATRSRGVDADGRRGRVGGVCSDVTATVSARSNTSGDLGAVLVTTAGRGSLDRYGQRLAEHLEVPTLELSLDRASARHFSVPFLSAGVLRELGGDAHIIRELYRQPGLLHLAHHRFGRYVCFLPRRYVLTVHDLIRYFDATGQEISITRPTARDRLYSHLDCAGMRRAEALISPSEATRADLVRHLGVAPEKIFVVNDGLDHALFWPVERRIVEPPYIGWAGSTATSTVGVVVVTGVPTTKAVIESSPL